MTPSTLFDLSGRGALVAGGAGALGEVICRELGSQGAGVLVCDLDQARCEAVARTIPGKTPRQHRGLGADLSTEAGCAAAAGWFAKDRRLDIVVHCIGLISAVPLAGYAVPFEQESLAAWEIALRVNLTSGFLLAKAVHERLRKSPNASFILVGSIYGVMGPKMSLYEGVDMENPVAYGASKGGLIQLMRYLATKWAPQVRVNCVSPGGIRRGQSQAFIERYERLTPLGRMATEADVAAPVVFLASDAARYITGHNLLVDGGWTAW
jgi:NAD(P)-dependent dehydrogenase (short-subunit alcohol dehydrogenase family)